MVPCPTLPTPQKLRPDTSPFSAPGWFDKPMHSRRAYNSMPEAHDLVERLDHSVLVSGVDVAGAVALAEPEDRLYD
jgi:hypothetical protein